MEDDKLLEELRTQRELIRKHLDWLDRRIGTLETTSDIHTETRASEDESFPKAIPTENEAPPPRDDEEEIFGQYQGTGGNDLMKVKLGCLVILILGTLLFLFLLFGLPHLIY